MAYCGEHTAVKGTSTQAVAISLKCKSWLCDHCTDMRKRQLMAQMAGGKPSKFITFTTRRVENMTPEQAAKRLSYAWRLCRLRIMRHLGVKSLPFICVIERHKSGWPHMHVLARMPWFSQKLLSKWMDELCDGKNVWIEHLDSSHKSVAYCAKYCGKCAQKIGTTKRYWQSQDYDQRENEDPKTKPLPGDGWELWQKNLASMAEAFKTWGYHVEWIAGDKIAAEKPPP